MLKLPALSPAGALPGGDRARRARHEPDRAHVSSRTTRATRRSRSCARRRGVSPSCMPSRRSAPSTRRKPRRRSRPRSSRRRPATASSTSAESVFPGEDTGLTRIERERRRRGSGRRTASSRSSSSRRARTERFSRRRTRSGRAEGPRSAHLIVAKPKAELRDDVGDAALAARDRVSRRRSSSSARWRSTSRAGSPRPVLALSEAADRGRAKVATTSTCRTCPAAARSAISPSASAR